MRPPSLHHRHTSPPQGLEAVDPEGTYGVCRSGRFEITVLSTGTASADKRSRAIQDSPHLSGFVDLSMMDAKAAREAVCGSGASWLIDLNGHTEGVRWDILALKSSPVQVRASPHLI